MQALQTSQVLTQDDNVLSLDEAADKLGVNVKSFRQWLSRNTDIREKYCFKTLYPNNSAGRIKTVINVEGLPYIASIRNLDGKNRTVRSFREGK